MHMCATYMQADESMCRKRPTESQDRGFLLLWFIDHPRLLTEELYQLAQQTGTTECVGILFAWLLWVSGGKHLTVV